MDRRRIVRPNADWSTITTILDLESPPAYQTIADTWTVTPPARKPQQAASQRRYGGSRTVGETHENGTLSWTTLVGGASADATLQNMSALLVQLEASRPGHYVEWRPDGATHSTYFEIRGPATWKPNYRWVQFAGVHSLTCEVQIPVAPLAVGEPAVAAQFTIDLPAVVEVPPLATGAGDAPALMTVKIARDGTGIGTIWPAWGLISWAQRPAGGLGGGDPPPFGIFSYDTSVGTGGYVHGSFRDDASFSLTEIVQWTVDTTQIPREEFSDELAVEVWGRFEMDASITDARAVLHTPEGVYSWEFGALGKLLPRPSSGSAFRMVRLGTLPVADEVATHVMIDTSWSAASGHIGLDYVVIVPVAQRAAGVTAKPLDDSYPALFKGAPPAIETWEKAILPDLSGRFGEGPFAATAIPAGRHTGIGGVPLEVPAGALGLLVKLSDQVPDDPTSGTFTESTTFDDTVVTVILQPRWFLARA